VPIARSGTTHHNITTKLLKRSLLKTWPNQTKFFWLIPSEPCCRSLASPLEISPISISNPVHWVISVNMYGYFWWFRLEILGLICINLQFMHVFLRLRSVLDLLSYDYRLTWFGPSFRRNGWVDVKPSEESWKASPIGPKQEDLRQIPRSKSSLKRSVQEVSKP